MKSTRTLLPVLGLFGVVAIALTAGEQPDGPFPPPSADGEDTSSRGLTATFAMDGAADAAPAEDDGAYRLDEVMVTLQPDVELAGLAHDLESRILDAAPDGRLALLEVPAGVSRADFQAALSGDPRVASAAPNAVMAGAGKKNKSQDRKRKEDDSSAPSTDTTAPDSTTGDSTTAPDGSTDGGTTDAPASGAPTPDSVQWYRDWIGVSDAAPAHISEITVAVLDSGVAYESDKIRGTNYAVPAGLQGVSFVSPKDFVDGDDQPLDEHQHGTHIAALIGAGGTYPGVASGVAIMPVRVLDENNRGTEYDLIQGIRWAMAEGADVINMSLSFAPGYVPSAALREALDAAAAAGVVLVGAAGNDARDDVPSWPAASPQVISVGASSIKVGEYSVTDHEAAYSNLGVGIDLMAPGGDLQTDYNGDGVPDGMVAESIAPGDPSTTGPWMFAGTSQAAAIVSAGAARLLAAGVAPEDVRLTMLEGSRYWGNDFKKGTGAGALDVDRALATEAAPWVSSPPRFGAALLPYPTQGVDLDGSVYARAEALVSVTVLGDASLNKFIEIFGTAWGPNGAESWSCKVKVSDPTCIIKGDSVAIGQLGDDPAASWAFSIEAVVESGIDVPHRPTSVLYASDALEVLLTAQEDHNKVRNRALAFEWTGEEDPVLGDTAPGYSVVNSGTGLATSPFGVVFTPDAVQMGGFKSFDLDLDGTGLATSPLGMFSVTRFNIDGTGLATSPLGFQELQLVAISGTGLATSPLGFTARDLLSPFGGAPSLGMGLDGGVMVLEDQAIVGASASADAMSSQALLDKGGFQADGGYELGDMLAGSGAVDVGLSVSTTAVAAGEDRMPLE